MVEDDRDTGEAFAALLALAGMKVAVAESVGDALKVLGAFGANVIVTDLALPHQDGFDLLREVRRRERRIGRRLPVIAVSALADHPEVRFEVARADFDACLLKPVDGAALVRAVRRAAR